MSPEPEPVQRQVGQPHAGLQEGARLRQASRGGSHLLLEDGEEPKKRQQLAHQHVASYLPRFARRSREETPRTPSAAAALAADCYAGADSDPTVSAGNASVPTTATATALIDRSRYFHSLFILSLFGTLSRPYTYVSFISFGGV